MAGARVTLGLDSTEGPTAQTADQAVADISGSVTSKSEPRTSARSKRVRSLPFIPPQMPNWTRFSNANERQSPRTGQRPQMAFALRSAVAFGAKKISGSYRRQRASSSQYMFGIVWAQNTGANSPLRPFSGS